MLSKINIEVNADLAEEAVTVLAPLGLDLEDATKVFLRRCILEQKLPFDINSVPSPSIPFDQEKKESTSSGKITQEMVEAVWDAFKYYRSNGGDLRNLADEVNLSSGMKTGSAFIYLVILDNLLEGQRNTRNMKMRDLEFYMNQIRAEYGKSVYANALSSLKKSLPYWKSQPLGNFADKVQAYLDEHPQDTDSIPEQPFVTPDREQLDRAFKDYLLSTTSPFTGNHYKENTANSYVSAINTVCAEEDCSWEDLAKQIDTLVIRYDKGGDKCEVGEEGHNSVINALRAYQRFSTTFG